MMLWYVGPVLQPKTKNSCMCLGKVIATHMIIGMLSSSSFREALTEFRLHQHSSLELLCKSTNCSSVGVCVRECRLLVSPSKSHTGRDYQAQVLALVLKENSASLLIIHFLKLEEAGEWSLPFRSPKSFRPCPPGDCFTHLPGGCQQTLFHDRRYSRSRRPSHLVRGYLPGL